MRIRFWETSGNSYVILEIVVTMMKLIGGLAILGSIITAVAVAADNSVTFVDSDARSASAIAIALSGIVSGMLLMAVGAAVDVFLGIDATVQRIGRRVDGMDETADILNSARRG